MSLWDQVRDAQKVVARWSKEKRERVQLEGGGLRCPDGGACDCGPLDSMPSCLTRKRAARGVTVPDGSTKP